jgi:CheY-like chemotaxis protein
MTAPLRILHLEDDPNDAELLLLHLAAEAIPHTIVQVNSQAEFTEALEKGTFDVILSDNSGPYFSGQSALALAREKLPHAAFLFVTGSVQGEATTAAMKSGSDGFVVKDRLSELVPAIQRALQAKNK